MDRGSDDLDRLPTIGDYFMAGDNLARVIRKALDARGSVTRGQVRRALEAFERVIKASERQ